MDFSLFDLGVVRPGANNSGGTMGNRKGVRQETSGGPRNAPLEAGGRLVRGGQPWQLRASVAKGVASLVTDVLLPQLTGLAININ